MSFFASRTRIFWQGCLLVAWVFISGSAYAGTMILETFVDQTTDPINLPAAKLLVATINTSGIQGGNDATATTVSVGGTVVPADIAPDWAMRVGER